MASLNAYELLILLDVSRTGRFTSAVEDFGLNHNHGLEADQGLRSSIYTGETWCRPGVFQHATPVGT